MSGPQVAPTAPMPPPPGAARPVEPTRPWQRPPRSTPSATAPGDSGAADRHQSPAAAAEPAQHSLRCVVRRKSPRAVRSTRSVCRPRSPRHPNRVGGPEAGRLADGPRVARPARRFSREHVRAMSVAVPASASDWACGRGQRGRTDDPSVSLVAGNQDDFGRSGMRALPGRCVGPGSPRTRLRSSNHEAPVPCSSDCRAASIDPGARSSSMA